MAFFGGGNFGVDGGLYAELIESRIRGRKTAGRFYFRDGRGGMRKDMMHSLARFGYVTNGFAVVEVNQ